MVTKGDSYKTAITPVLDSIPKYMAYIALNLSGPVS